MRILKSSESCLDTRPPSREHIHHMHILYKKMNKQIKRLKIYAQWIEIRNLSLIIDIISLIASGFVSTPKQRACLTLREPIVTNTNKNENRQWDSGLIGSTATVWGKVKCQSVKNTLQPVLTSPKLFIILHPCIMLEYNYTSELS